MLAYILTALTLVAAAVAALAQGGDSTAHDVQHSAIEVIQGALFRGDQSATAATSCVQRNAGALTSDQSKVLIGCGIGSSMPAMAVHGLPTVTSLAGCLSGYPSLHVIRDNQPADGFGNKQCAVRLQVNEAIFVPTVLASKAGGTSAPRVIPASGCTSDCDVGLAGPFAQFWRSQTGAAVSYATYSANGSAYYVILKHTLP